MAGNKINLDPAVVLEWLLDRCYVEHTSSASHPYRVAINEDDNLPYSITYLTNRLSIRFSNIKLRSINRRVWKRELYRCLDEYQVLFDDRATRANAHWEFEDTTKKYLETKLHIDLDQLHEHDRHLRSKRKGGMRYTSYFNQAKGRYGEEVALEKFRKYFERRMQDLSVDQRTNRYSKKKKHKQPLEDVESSRPDIPTAL
jgi:hypothetical protein